MQLAAALRAAAAPDRVLIVDCLTLWLSNLLCSEDPQILQHELQSLYQAFPHAARPLRVGGQ